MVPSVSSVANLTNLLSICTTVVLLVICLVGDRLDRIPSIQGWVRALADSGTHGAVGAISWLIVLIGSKAWQEQEVLLLLNPFASFTSNRLVCEVVACGMVALFIDIDHFIAAGSFDLKKATSLKYRPFFHVTTYPLVIIPLILILVRYFVVTERIASAISRISMIVLVAFLSHHFRDAWRRGLCIPPISMALPVSYKTYLAVVTVLPYLVKAFYYLFHREGFKARSASYNMDVV